MTKLTTTEMALSGMKSYDESELHIEDIPSDLEVDDDNIMS